MSDTPTPPALRAGQGDVQHKASADMYWAVPDMEPRFFILTDGTFHDGRAREQAARDRVEAPAPAGARLICLDCVVQHEIVPRAMKTKTTARIHPMPADSTVCGICTGPLAYERFSDGKCLCYYVFT